MNYSMDHDAICVQEVNQMYNLGCFAEQFVTYVTCCVMDNECRYFVSDKAENAYQFCQERLKEEVYCLPVRKTAQSSLVPSGHREDMQQQFKWEAAYDLRKDGGSETARLIASLARPANNTADDLLKAIQRSLNGCFDKEILQVFQGILDHALAARKLSPLSYWKMQQWVETTLQDDEERIKHDVHERIYSGFGYYKVGSEMYYYYNAVEAVTLEKQALMRCQSYKVTPIFKKRYCFSDVDKLTSIALDFKGGLKKRFDHNYQKLLQIIDALPGVIDKSDFQAAYEQATIGNDLLRQNAIAYYASLWQVW